MMASIKERTQLEIMSTLYFHPQIARYISQRPINALGYLFFSCQNVNYLLQLYKVDNLDQFFESMIEMYDRSLQFTCLYKLAQLNARFIEYLQASVRASECHTFLWRRYFIDKTRDRIAPYPQFSSARSKSDTVDGPGRHALVSTAPNYSNYSLNNYGGQRFIQDYRATVLGICC